MNRIEDEWLHLKRDELSARVFEDEYDLAIAIQQGIQARGKRANYQVERWRNSICQPTFHKRGSLLD